MRFACWALVVAVMLVSGVAGADGKPIETATPVEQAAARDAYVAAKEHFDADRLGAALAGFRKSYGIVASPNSHLMVARVLDLMGQPVQAYTEMQATMREAEAAAKLGPGYEKYEKTLTIATGLTAKLRRKVGLVRIVLVGATPLPPGSILSVGGTPVQSLAEPVVVRPGVVHITLQTPHGRSEQTAQVGEGRDLRVPMEVPAASQVNPDPAPRPTPATGVNYPLIFGVAAGVVGVAGLAMFGGFGVASNDAFDELEATCAVRRCPATAQPTIEDGKQYQTLANVGLIVGIGGTVASVALILVGVTSEETGWLMPTENGVAVGGRF